VVSGLKALRREYAGQMWLEIMVLKGLNDSEEELTSLKGLLREIAPDRVQLNTAVRPVADQSAQALTREEMEAVAAFLGEGAEVVAAAQAVSPERLAVEDHDILEMLARRPMTARQLGPGTGGIPGPGAAAPGKAGQSPAWCIGTCTRIRIFTAAW
jgi:wyosine [tRNA(Phe)-imidazoG37] synthetase (radical SAM superfamily)